MVVISAITFDYLSISFSGLASNVVRSYDMGTQQTVAEFIDRITETNAKTVVNGGRLLVTSTFEIKM